MFGFLDKELDELLWDVNRTEVSHCTKHKTRILSSIIGKFSDHICVEISELPRQQTKPEYIQAHRARWWNISLT